MKRPPPLPRRPAPIARHYYLRELRAVYTTNRALPRAPGPLRTPDDVARYLAPIFSSLAHEHIGALYVDVQHRPICVRMLSRGTADAAMCHPRDVWQSALLCNASAIHLGHNHPSGDATPSADDRRLDARLRSAADILGIPLLSFFVFGHLHAIDIRDGLRIST